MPPEETATKSPLDKPLHQLTEDDISQLTREDCRRYLKQKGMRRPSWNKSQAIQQVISLKTLLETTPDSDPSATRKKLYLPRLGCENVNAISNSNTTNNPQQSVSRGTSADAEISESADETVPHNQKDGEKPDVSGHPVEDCDPPRNTGSENVPAGQMTIFYCGKVNVYDDVPADKARAIMHLAASPLHLPQDAPFDHSLAMQPSCHIEAASAQVRPDSAALLFPTAQIVKMSENTRLLGDEYRWSEENPAEGPGSRKASVQRYLEKRKDRYKSKKKVLTTSSTSLDVYLNHQIGNHTANEHSSRSATCSPPQIRPVNTPIRCSSMEDAIAKNANKDINEWKQNSEQ